MSQFDDNRSAITTIAEESPEAAGLVFALMEHSARERDWIEEQVRGSLELERDRWRMRAIRAERHLAMIQMRFDDLLAPPPYGFDPYDAGP